MSTPSFLPEETDPGPALAIASINLIMASNLAWASLLLGDSGVRLILSLGAHEAVGDALARTVAQRTTQCLQARDASTG